MIDRENYVYTQGKEHIKSLCPNTGQTYSGTNALFPYMFFRQIDNPADGYDLDGKEVGVKPTVEIHIYTNGNGALSSNKKICQSIDEEMVAQGFQRMYGPAPLTSLSDSKITEQVIRYKRLFCSGDIL